MTLTKKDEKFLHSMGATGIDGKEASMMELHRIELGRQEQRHGQAIDELEAHYMRQLQGETARAEEMRSALKQERDRSAVLSRRLDYAYMAIFGLGVLLMAALWR